ncbi:hypothetical protein EOPP23_00490 [Endozoicomonas sp. OPT23]|uniref:TetR/AcrR family transcriptional regulator n=1 Tax=Endozoicomonas sp. OPT23 TaxID=2072845 RepID=UPI00129BC926|nr:TetR/AcrR family transcriptional regulator [Endozoicomonas sp. OPT23]MRI31467.1 hypothetical protein [Endozoicomonas sp. OPT23]
MSLREKGKARRKQQIIDAVVSILCDEGFAALSTSKIAERAEVSVATLYNLMGSIDSILDVMVEQLSNEFKSAFKPITESQDPIAIIEAVSDSAYEFLNQDIAKYQAILKAVFQINISRDHSAPVFLTANNNRTLFVSAINQLQDSGRMLPDISAQLLSQQMLVTQIFLLQNWSAGVIDLERYCDTSKFHFLLLIKAWAAPELASELETRILEIQSRIEALDALKRKPQSSNASDSNDGGSLKTTRIEKEVISHENRSLQETGS